MTFKATDCTSKDPRNSIRKRSRFPGVLERLSEGDKRKMFGATPSDFAQRSKGCQNAPRIDQRCKGLVRNPAMDRGLERSNKTTNTVPGPLRWQSPPSQLAGRQRRAA